MYDGQLIPMTHRPGDRPRNRRRDHHLDDRLVDSVRPGQPRPSVGIHAGRARPPTPSATPTIRSARRTRSWPPHEPRRQRQGPDQGPVQVPGPSRGSTRSASTTRGTAFYADNSVVPHVTKEMIDSCIPAGLSQVIHNAAGIIALDGSTSACGWGSDSDAAVKGIFGRSNLPMQFRKDYELNANDSYWQSNAKAPLTGYSPIIGCEQCAQGLRHLARPRDAGPADGRRATASTRNRSSRSTTCRGCGSGTGASERS